MGTIPDRGSGSLATTNRATAKEGVSAARYVMQNMDMMQPMLRRDREILARIRPPTPADDPLLRRTCQVMGGIAGTVC